MAWSSESAGSGLCNARSTFARCARSSERRAVSAFAISSCSFMSRCIQIALKGAVPTNYPATTEPHGLRRSKSINAMIAGSRSKRQRHDPPTAKGDNPAQMPRYEGVILAAVDISTPSDPATLLRWRPLWPRCHFLWKPQPRASSGAFFAALARPLTGDYIQAMCGRVIQSSGPLRYAIVDGMNVRDSRMHNYPPRWNGAPSQDLLVIRRNHKTGEVSLDPLRWGLIPY